MTQQWLMKTGTDSYRNLKKKQSKRKHPKRLVPNQKRKNILLSHQNNVFTSPLFTSSLFS